METKDAATCGAVQFGCACTDSAATPATCGAAIDVPERMDAPLPESTAAEAIDTPGAATSGLMALSPDRIALYGYAHVPWMAKRQVMIPDAALPDPQARLRLFEVARDLLVADGYEEIGIDHFARPGDGLATAQKAGLLRRNFQGYTDDLATALIGMGASSISRFPQGYAQNAPATGAHVKAIREGRFSTTKGHVFTPEDIWRARMIEALMCDFRISADEFIRDHGFAPAALAELFAPVKAQFGEMVTVNEAGLSIPERGRPLTRMIARMLDGYEMEAKGHSPAI